MLSRQMAKDTAGESIIVSVAPGSIEGSDMIEEVIDEMCRMRNMTPEKARAYVESGTPLRRMQSMEEVAKMIEIGLHTPEYMSGTCIEAPGAG